MHHNLLEHHNIRFEETTLQRNKRLPRKIGSYVVVESNTTEDSDKFPNISIKTDLSPLQTEHISNLREELQRRQQEEEISLTIKYIKNVPQITPTTSERSRDEDNSPKRMNGSKISKPESFLSVDPRK
ncbi:hypothetical protein JTB14_037021 [Gonioctena quinquepunctata]|nr:hypothetical protein JTB14_037021 [Gonioctena quinquepunctata]